MKKNGTDIITPFDWQRYTAPASSAPGTPPRKNVARRQKKALTVRERVERILAHRWGNPYCKPGAV